MPPPPIAETGSGTGPGYGAFVAGVGSWFGAWGMQGVLFSWLVVGELEASAEWVGVAQMSTMLPSLVLLLVGGAVADRFDSRRLLSGLHALAAVPVLLLAAGLATGHLSMAGLIAYGVAQGTVSAFAMPARDSLLAAVAGTDMMRAVTGMTAVQFGAQALGSLVAGAARWVGGAPALVVQAGVLLVGSLASHRLPPAAPRVRSEAPRSPLHEIGEGLAVVAREPRLRGPILLVASVGMFFIGPFMVVFPLLVRDFYGGSVGQLSIVLMLFPLGTVLGSVVIRQLGGVAHKGVAALSALVVGALMLGAIGLGLPFWGMVLATMAWGVAGSVFINSSRTLYQEAAPAAQRGRVLSVYQIGFLGTVPLGALLTGLAVGAIGPLHTLKLFAAVMLTTVALATALSSIRHMR